MAKQYIYAPINPIWMNEVITFNSGYNTLPFDYQTGREKYTQKVKFAFPTKFQVLSDWVPTLKIYQCDTGAVVDTISPTTPTTGINGQTFTCYEFTITWGSYPAGMYYIEITYTDDSSVLHINRSGEIQSATNWPGALVYQYKNSQNDFSVLFSTGIEFTIVIEGAIAEFEPGFEDVIYEDQYHNTTKLNAIPHRQFTLYAGSATGFAGMPTYMGDKLNWVFSCDQIKIDGQYYQNTDGSKWETARTPPNGTNFIGLKITIIEVNNLFLQQYDAGLIPAGSVKVIDRVKEYLNNSANITISGVFTAASVLTKIVIYNHGGNIFTINASTAADGSVPIAPPFTTTGAAKDVWFIDEPFDVVATLYLLGLAGSNCDIYVQYDQLDAPFIIPPVSTNKHVKGDVGEYEEVTVGDFSADWNIGTGEGMGRYEGCVISGTNGTKDRNGLVSVGWNPSLPLTRDTVIGAANNLVSLAAGNLPSFNISIGKDTKHDTGSGPAGVQVLSSQNPGPGSNGSVNIPYVGANNPIDISNRARVTLKYVCITD